MTINMSYCKFENTLAAMQECAEDWEECDGDLEIQSKDKLIQVMVDLLNKEGFYLEKANAKS